MSHHRETVMPRGARARRALLARRQGRRAGLPLGPDRRWTPTPASWSRARSATRRAAAWTTSRSSPRPPARRSRMPCDDASTSPTWLDFGAVNEVYGEYFPPIRPRASRSAWPRCRSAPRSRWTRSSPCPTDGLARAAGDRRRRSPRSSARAPHAGAVLAHDLRARGRRAWRSRRRTCSAPGRSRSAARPPSSPRSAEGRAHGVVCASAGNHAPGGRRRRRASRHPVRGVRAARRADRQGRRGRGQGAIVHFGGESRRRVRRHGARARRRAGSPSCTRSTTRTSSPARARSGSSCSRTSRTSRAVVMPVGGGGLASGMAIAIKAARPEVEVFGVQVAACAPYPESLRRGEPVPVTRR